MSFLNLLVHKGYVLRRQSGEDRFHNPIEDYDVLTAYAGIPCRATVSSLGGGFANLGGERLDETSTHVMEDRRVYFPPGLGEIREDDRIYVLDKHDELIFPESDITFVRKIYDGVGEEHHVEVLVKVWRRGDE